MPDATAVARALLDAWMTLAGVLPGGSVHRTGDMLGAVTGVAVPSLNGVFIAEVSPDVSEVAALVDEVAASGLPHSLQFRPGAERALEPIARGRGMTRVGEIPVMALDRPSGMQGRTTPAELVIRELRPDEAALHARVTADGFEVAAAPFLQLMTPAVLALDGARCYLGEMYGAPVATGYALTRGEGVGVFNIATSRPFRARGYGSAVTARAVADGAAAGAEWAWLQATAAGYPVYERLGFRTVERWRCWIAVPATG